MLTNRQERGCGRQHRECSRVDRIRGRNNDRGKRTKSGSNTSVVPVSYNCRTEIVQAVLDRQRSGVNATIWWFCHDHDRSGRSAMIGNIGKEWSAACDLLGLRPSAAPVGILRRCCGSYTAWHGCTLMVRSNNLQGSTGTPRDARAGAARAPHGNLQCFHILRDPYGARAGPARVPYGTLTATYKGIDTTRICKNPTRASYVAVWGPYGTLTVPARAAPGLLTISKPIRSP